IRQVLWNLLSNAVKFTDKNGTIWVTADIVDSDIAIAISDTGKGIASEEIAYVFEKFWQEDSSFKRNNNGLGIGLSIVKNIIESHGGSITCTSPGKDMGTTFTAKLPIFSADDQRKARVEMAKTTSKSDSSFNAQSLKSSLSNKNI